MDAEQIQVELENLDDEAALNLLLVYGHELTIQARSSYEFQGAGVDDPRLLRDCNEIQHRLFQAIKEITSSSEDRFSLSGISYWIYSEDRNKNIQNASIKAFKRALNKCNT
mgnify:CR=1 FL=1